MQHSKKVCPTYTSNAGRYWICLIECVWSNYYELDLGNGLYGFRHIGNEFEVGPGHDAHLFEIKKKSKIDFVLFSI